MFTKKANWNKVGSTGYIHDGFKLSLSTTHQNLTNSDSARTDLSALSVKFSNIRICILVKAIVRRSLR